MVNTSKTLFITNLYVADEKRNVTYTFFKLFEELLKVFLVRIFEKHYFTLTNGEKSHKKTKPPQRKPFLN